MTIMMRFLRLFGRHSNGKMSKGSRGDLKGMVVRLKSRGPAMTVNGSCNSKGYVKCTWFHKDNRILEHVFHRDAIKTKDHNTLNMMMRLLRLFGRHSNGKTSKGRRGDLKGMVVWLKSGGPAMTVNGSCNSNGYVKCTWFHKDNSILEHVFHRDAIKTEDINDGEIDEDESDNNDEDLWQDDDDRSDGDPSVFRGDPDDYEYCGLSGKDAMTAWNNTH
jgi:uncharacterized protein YodC (DUF2158 family)